MCYCIVLYMFVVLSARKHSLKNVINANVNVAADDKIIPNNLTSECYAFQFIQSFTNWGPSFEYI